MQQSLAWHKQRLRDASRYMVAEDHRISLLQSAADRFRAELYHDQIARAEAEGRDGFDADRFGRTRAGTSQRDPDRRGAKGGRRRVT